MRFLDDEWCAFVAARGAALPERPGATLTMHHTISGVPEVKKRQVLVDVVDGRIVRCEATKKAEAACTVQWAYADAYAALGGADLEVAFMRGDLKLDGDYRAFLLDLRPVFASPEGAALLAEVRAATEA